MSSRRGPFSAPFFLSLVLPSEAGGEEGVSLPAASAVDNGAVTSARNAGLTTLNTSATNVAPFTTHCDDNTDPAAAGSLTTVGTAFTATFNVTSPLAWGFDEGGYIYRDASTNSVFDGATLGAALKKLEAEWIASGFSLDRAALLGRAASEIARSTD